MAKKLTFKMFLEDESRTGAKLPFYPDLVDVTGQYPPLAATASAADFVTYFYMQFPNGMPTTNGVVQVKPGKMVFKN